jgi:hypothetical protein
MNSFRIDGDIRAIHADERADGGVLEIECHDDAGSPAVLRLEFTSDGVDRFQEVVTKFARTCHEARGALEAPRTVAAESTSAGAKNAERKHVRRYVVARIPDHEVERLLATIQPYCSEPPPPGFAGADRAVIWRDSVARAESETEGDRHLYLSPGAARAVHQEGMSLTQLGEVSAHDLPAERDLLVGDPPLDWQDTAFFGTKS